MSAITIDRLVQLYPGSLVDRVLADLYVEAAVEAYGPDRDPADVLVSWDGLHDAFFGYTTHPDYRWVRPGLTYQTISAAIDLNVIDRTAPGTVI